METMNEHYETSWAGDEVLCSLEDGQEYVFLAAGRWPSWEILEGGPYAESFLFRNGERLEEEFSRQGKYFRHLSRRAR